MRISDGSSDVCSSDLDDVHQGLARAAVKVGQALTIEGGALATRARSDIRGSAAGFDGPQIDNVTQVYAFYVGPSFATRAGPVDLTASYRLGYVKVEAPGDRKSTRLNFSH